MFALRKIFVGTLCALLGVMPVWGAGNANSEFPGEYKEDFITSYVGYMGGLLDVELNDEKTVGWAAGKYREIMSEIGGGQMDPDTQKFVGALCNRMQKYIRDNYLNVSVSVDTCGISHKNALDIDCGSTDSCMVFIVPQMAKAIEGEERFISEQRSLQPNLESTAKRLCDVSSKNFSPMLRKAISWKGEKKIDCAKDRNICIVNQPVKCKGENKNLVICCQITNGVENLLRQVLDTKEYTLEYCLGNQSL